MLKSLKRFSEPRTPNYTYTVKGMVSDPIRFYTGWGVPYIQYIAEDAAEDHYDKGFTQDWPVEISVFKDDKLLGTFSVEVERSLSFSTRLLARGNTVIGG